MIDDENSDNINSNYLFIFILFLIRESIILSDIEGFER